MGSMWFTHIYHKNQPFMQVNIPFSMDPSWDQQKFRWTWLLLAAPKREQFAWKTRQEVLEMTQKTNIQATWNNKQQLGGGNSNMFEFSPQFFGKWSNFD